jgi:hypothetical protein
MKRSCHLPRVLSAITLVRRLRRLLPHHRSQAAPMTSLLSTCRNLARVAMPLPPTRMCLGDIPILLTILLLHL